MAVKSHVMSVRLSRGTRRPCFLPKRRCWRLEGVVCSSARDALRLRWRPLRWSSHWQLICVIVVFGLSPGSWRVRQTEQRLRVAGSSPSERTPPAPHPTASSRPFLPPIRIPSVQVIGMVAGARELAFKRAASAEEEVEAKPRFGSGRRAETASPDPCMPDACWLRKHPLRAIDINARAVQQRAAYLSHGFSSHCGLSIAHPSVVDFSTPRNLLRPNIMQVEAH
jgi:hypothetical protein